MKLQILTLGVAFCLISFGLTQDFCLLSPDTGPCKAYIPSYYYDKETGNCNTFVYGGCDGNGNRFETKQLCLNTCAEEPLQQNICQLSPESGPCKENIPSYYYDLETGTCNTFVYGGCEGNDNRFQTKQLCLNACVKEPLQQNFCLLPVETGPCKASFPRYFFDKETGTCNTFVYGGCGGNGNRFETKQMCLNTCVGEQLQQISSDICQLLPESGPCKAYIPRYYYNTETGTCNTFVYGGCDGNGNRFQTIQMCLNACAKELLQQNFCLLSPETGPCKAYIPSYYYDKETGTCRTFVYGGCDGNGNRFQTEQMCLSACTEEPL